MKSPIYKRGDVVRYTDVFRLTSSFAENVGRAPMIILESDIADSHIIYKVLLGDRQIKVAEVYLWPIRYC